VTSVSSSDSAYGGQDTIVGGGGNDILVGGSGADTIYGDEAPNVVANGAAGNDILLGDNGVVSLPAGVLASVASSSPTIGGNDWIAGGGGSDLIVGGLGDDTIYADAAPGLPSNTPDGNDVVIGDNGAIQAPGWVVTSVSSSDSAYGGQDTIDGGAGSDLLIGGSGSDRITADDGNDVVLGDNGTILAPNGVVATVQSTDTAVGGSDTIAGGAGDDLLIGGAGSDSIDAGAGDDVALGDSGTITVAGTLNFEDVTTVTVADDATGGNDTIYGRDGQDVLIGGAGSDRIDGGNGNDMIFGDNVALSRLNSLTDFTDPRFRLLTGSVLYDPTTLLPAVGTAWQRNPDGAALWSNYRITFLDANPATAPANSYGNDYIAGGAGDDRIFGQLGNDTIQGDGSIDGPGANVGASRDAGNNLVLSPSFDATTDGNDYIEGGGGSDVIFGNGGQDDIVGGNSDLFGLLLPAVRPDGADMVFGGSGTFVGLDDPGDTTASGHANDADVIVGDNGDIYRPVTAADVYYTFGYDNYSTKHIVPRAVGLLDYTPGGPDYSTAALSNIGGADEIHGEAGDDVVYGGPGNDMIFGDGQNDTLYGGWGNDWISGGTGDDGILGDDGLLMVSRNGTAEPLYNIGAIPTGGLDLAISTPGNVQQATINVTGALKYTAIEQPFNLDPNLANQNPLFRPLYANDVIFGGLGNDSLHGGAGDDAISGAEALPVSWMQTESATHTFGVVESDFFHPYNTGDPLLYNANGADPTRRADEFALYDEYDPLRRIRLTPSGQLDKTGTGLLWFLDFNAADGPVVAGATDVITGNPIHTDGNDVLFGDLGNDWAVGGTGNDTLWGGYGNDMLNAVDDQTTDGEANDVPDGPQATYEDRAYGGAGRDILIANTGGDRLIDWAGEFNTYLVPFAPFGLGTVSRTLQPQLPEFLYALSASQGADPTRAAKTGADPTRNGEPEGELGLVLQHDADWQAQTGGPIDPQAGNIPGGARDVLRGANFNNTTTLQAAGFVVDSGVWTIANGQLQVAAASVGQEATSLFNLDQNLPVYYEITASMSTQKPTAGWNANSFVLFDYFSSTDFKFAGLDFSTNKMVIGHRTASGWFYDAQSPFNSSLKPGTSYQVLVAVNGTAVTVSVNNSQSFTFTFAPRILDDGTSVGLNHGFVGFGSNDSRGTLDNLNVQVLPTPITLQTADVFGAGMPAQFATGLRSGAWTVGGGLASASAASGQTLISTASLDHSIATNSLLDVTTNVRTTSVGGVAFDTYAANDFKFAAIDVNGQQVVVGHVDPRRGWVTQASFGASVVSGVNYTLDVTLKDSVATVSLNGNVLGSFVYNAAVTDGKVGMLTSGGTSSFASFALKTSDPSFNGSPKVSSAQLPEGNSGTTAVSLTISLAAAATTSTTLNWTTVDGTAKAGTDYQGASGTATIAAGATSATVTVYVIGNTIAEPDKYFGVALASWAGLPLEPPTGLVTIQNDDPAASTTPSFAVANVTTTEGDQKTATWNVPVYLTKAATATVSVVATTVAGTATATSDFISTSATLTFAPGVTTAYLPVQIVGDTIAEPTETFSVVLSSPSTGTTISRGTGTVTIIDNDGAMFAAASAPVGTAEAAPLTESALAPVLADAEAAWRAVLPHADFSAVSVTIADLAGNLLGFTLGKSITIDPTAAGWGWSVMDPGSGALRMDLRTVLTHELGLALGFREADPAEPYAMARTLAATVAPPGPPLLLPLDTPAAVAPVTVTRPWISARGVGPIGGTPLVGRLHPAASRGVIRAGNPRPRALSSRTTCVTVVFCTRV
jgi:Ca2+-binding RTX toxin-like protein